nr:MAG TPA: hypothetical protein [Herelleviridae sp.]
MFYPSFYYFVHNVLDLSFTILQLALFQGIIKRYKNT